MNNLNNLLDDTLRVRLPSRLKDKLIAESANLNIDLSELVRQQLTQFIINTENRIDKIAGLSMCDPNIYEAYKLTSKIPTKDLTYDQILFLTAHNHCCGKHLTKDNNKNKNNLVLIT